MKTRCALIVSLIVIIGLALAACGTPATQAPAEVAGTEALQPTQVESAAPATEAPPTPAAGETAASPVATEAPSTAPAPEVSPEAVATPAPSGAIKRGGILKVGFEADFLNLDPAFQEAWVDMVPPDMAYDTLLKWDPETLQPQPMLAKSWEVSKDGLLWTFKLQDGVKWHNGDEFTADDVKFSIERINDPNSGATIKTFLESIKSVEVIDKLTVAFHMQYPYSPLLDTLCNVPSIQNKKFVEANGGTTPRKMMGTGPFIFKEWIPDQVLRFEKNPNYWRMGEDGKPLPYLDGIDFIPQADETARLADFLAGVTDFMDLVPDKDVAKLKENPDVVMYGPKTLWYSSIYFNNTKPPFDNKLVRQAISWAMDREEITIVGLFGQASPMYGGAVPDWHWAGNQLRVYERRDVEKAKKLLAEAGYPDGKGFPEITIYTGQPYQSEITNAEMTANYLKDIGITAKVEVQEWGTFFDNVRNGKFLIWSTGESPLGDPDTTYYNTFYSKGSWNYGHYSNPKVDQLLEQGRVEANPAKRKEIYRQIEEILLDDVPEAFTLFHQVWLASHLYVKNFVKPANDRYFTLANIWLDK